MIPASVAKAAVTRFEKAVTKRARAPMLDHAITFEYRQSKRELLALFHLLRTGENPDNSMELPFQIETTRVAGSNKPAEPQATR